MKLRKVEAKQCGYDQYDTLIVWTETETQAISVAIKFTTDFRGRSNFTDGATATEVIAPSVACVELGSFNASYRYAYGSRYPALRRPADAGLFRGCIGSDCAGWVVYKR